MLAQTEGTTTCKAPSLVVDTAYPLYIWPCTPTIKTLTVFTNYHVRDASDGQPLEGRGVYVSDTRPRVEPPPVRLSPKMEPFTIIVCPVAFQSIKIQTGSKGFVQCLSSCADLQIKAGGNSVIDIGEGTTTSATVTTGANSSTNLYGQADDVVVQSGPESWVNALKGNRRALEATFKGNGTLHCAHTECAIVAAQGGGHVEAKFTACHYIEPKAYNLAQVNVATHNPDEMIWHYAPTLHGKGVINLSADRIYMLDAKQLPPRRGGKINIALRDPVIPVTLFNGCREPRKGVVSIVTAAL